MSVMERRLQLLLDAGRYARVEKEAVRSGRSVSAVIREAIDWRFDDGQERRQEAAARLLESAIGSTGVEPDWQETEAAVDAELAAKLDDSPNTAARSGS